MLKNLRGLFSRDLSIDLGTANTLIFVRDEGIVLNEPSVVAIRTNDNRSSIAAVGHSAKRMLGRTPGSITAIRPLRDGVIADFLVTEKMLQYFIKQVHEHSWIRPSPRVLVCIPCKATEVERRAIRESALSAGARDVRLIEEPMAAAIGAGLKVWEPVGNMIVDIGGGTTEVAVISLGGIVTSKSSRVGGDELDEAIVQYVKKEFGLSVGERTAEQIKIELGSAYPLDHEQQAEIRGVDLVTGLPRVATITTMDIRIGLEEPLNAITDAIRNTLDRTPPELAADIIRHGIVMAGGGALLRGLDQRIANETAMPIRVTPDPLYAVVRGSGHMLEHMARLPETVLRPDGE